MNREKVSLLNYRRFPGRLNVEQTAELLAMKPHKISVLVAQGLLKPLGKPAQNGPKYFASATVVGLMRNPDFLHKAAKAT